MSLPDNRYQRAADIALRQIAGESFLIILDVGESRMFALNAMGLWFWKQLEEPQTPAQLLETMLCEYEVAEVAARSEIERFLTYLLDKELICQV